MAGGKECVLVLELPALEREAWPRPTLVATFKLRLYTVFSTRFSVSLYIRSFHQRDVEHRYAPNTMLDSGDRKMN